MLALGVVLGLIGPFGTFAIPDAPRIAYWMSFAVIGYAIYRPMIIVGDWLNDRFQMSRIIGAGMALALSAMPMTFIVAWLFSGFDVSRALRWDGLGLLYFQVWLIGFLVTGFFQLLFPKTSIPTESAGDSLPDTNDPIFLTRLPLGFGPIYALRGEDHYVRAIGKTREELILIRLRDAMTELNGIDGMAVHRSWWVAQSAVKSIRRDGRALSLILRSGHEVPVARDKVPLLRKAGWLH